MLNTFVSIYVPSNVEGARIDSRPYVSKIAKKLSELFGGATSSKAQGAWVDGQGKLITETITIVKSFTDSADLARKRPLIYALARELKSELKQELLSLEFNEGLELI